MQTSRSPITPNHATSGRVNRIVAPLSWEDRSACRGLDATIFYPDPDDQIVTDRAPLVCIGCEER